jgi:H+/Cl- antiporter ClcA
MSTIEKIGEIGVGTVLIILPILGMTYTLAKSFIRGVITLSQQLKNESVSLPIFAILCLLLILIVSGGFLSITLIILFWFPKIDLPDIVRNISVILLFPYGICFFIFYGLSRAVAAGYGSASGLLNKVFDIVSNKSGGESNTKEKT